MVAGNRVLRYALAAALASVAAGGCDDRSDPSPLVCARADGVWDVRISVNGLDGTQRWTISQAGCDLTVTPETPYCTGIFIGANPATGGIAEDRLWANWVSYCGACKDSSSLDATVSGSTMTGTVYWYENPYGVGYCPSAYGSSPMTGTRL